MAVAKRSLLSLLGVYGEESGPELDSEAGTMGSAGAAPTGENGGLVSVGYGADDFTCLDGDEEGDEQKDDENSRQSEDDDSETEKPEAGDLKKFPDVEERDSQEPVASFSERHWNMSPNEINIPPEPPGRCSNQLQDKIQKLYEMKMEEGMDMNYMIQRKRKFHNPSLYENLIQFFSIDGIGTNYPKDIFDPHSWSEDSYYETLAKAQKIEMDKLLKAKRKHTKIEFVTGTKKGTSAASTTTTTSSTTVGDAQKKRRSK